MRTGFIPPTIYQLIDDYASEKYRRFPMTAGGQRRILRHFAEQMQINHVHEITKEHVAFFAGEQLTGFYTAKALTALRQFLWYCRQAGYQCLAHNACSMTELQKVEGNETISETPSWEAKPFWQKEGSPAI